jgi:N-acetylglucosaminyldiphosphoundecaprenol N-acetyl-beta-D-mannosaminyltransferase
MDSNRYRIISIYLEALSRSAFMGRSLALAETRQSSMVCFANVHMCIEAWRNSAFADMVNGADLVAPDGKPLAMVLGRLAGTRQERIAGMDVFPEILTAAADRGLKVFFYGSTPEVLSRLVSRARTEHPVLQIAGWHSPPFRALTAAEERKIIDTINASGAQMVFIALGCPKQERWMAAMRGRVRATMFGVGNAFAVYIGLERRAPRWMQKFALEWLYRLCQDPRRLLRRYLVTNILFAFLLLREVLVTRRNNSW